jgi:phosphomannomutase
MPAPIAGDASPHHTLRSQLAYEPRELTFGTSGRRALIRDLTPVEICINVSAEIAYLQSLMPDQGGIIPGDDFYFARDLRPSSEGIAAVVQQCIREAAMNPVNLGTIPTPALTGFALAHGKASIMVTGSHIPFDRNGYKLNTSRGELLKEHEPAIGAFVGKARRDVYAADFDHSPFAADGSFRIPPEPLRPELPAAAEAWVKRYLHFAGGNALAGLRILVYQHSAVGRDLLVEILEALGAEAVPVGRSESFVPIDTENIGAAELTDIQSLYDTHGPAHAVVSTDGDSDRPLILAPDTAGQLCFFSGDLVGMIVSQYLEADAVVVPISCNDAVDRSALAAVLEPKTRIGSPWVIAGMQAALAKGKKVVCGWEANGGFLLGSDIEQQGRKLPALATRDAFLPIVAVLCQSAARRLSLADLFAELPARFGRAGLLRNFPRADGLRIIQNLNPATSKILANGDEVLRALSRVFLPENGFLKVLSIDYTDGVRIHFENGDVTHIRPSGNADELRIYAVSNTPERAAEIVRHGLAEPAGILRRLERILR